MLGPRRALVGMGQFPLNGYLASVSASWWDNTKTDDQFQENVGPTAADDVGEAIGLKMDRGLWRGQTFAGVVAAASEIVTNGTFDSATTGWTGDGATLASSGGQLEITSSGLGFAGRAIYPIPTSAGKLYRIVLDSITASNAVRVGSVSAGVDLFPNTGIGAVNGRVIYFAAAGATSYLSLVGSSTLGNKNYFDNVSIKLIPGYAAIQATAASRPTVRRPASIYLARGDGVDDHSVTTLNPSTSMTLIEIGTPDTGSASDVLIGSQPAADGKAYLALDANGYLGGGVGTQNTTTIVDQGSVDIRGVRCGKAIKWDGSTVSLFINSGSGFRKAYEAAQSGAVNTTVAMYLLGLNNNGSFGAAADTDTEHLIAIPSAIPDAKIAQIINSLL